MIVMNKPLSQSKEQNLIQIATLKKPYGIKGWLWVFSHMDNHTDIFALKNWQMKTAIGFKPLTVTNWRQQGSGLVASFKEIADRNIAETMNGVSIWVDKTSLPALAEDEYYWSDLEGLTVINQQGENLGVIDVMFETGAHEIMDVKPTKDSIDNEKRLIPWHTDTVLNVDLEAATILVAWEKDY